tara:strand:+ start:1101 stop:2135 length:1035 start_codon:yes stop_codon:yes gene_type:complete
MIDLILKGQVYLFLIIFVMMIAGMIKEHKLFKDLFCFFEQSLKSKKAVVAVVSALSGLLPIKGRVTVSAGMLDTLAPPKPHPGREKFGPIDYLATHHYYFWSPLEKTVILPMAAFGLSYAAFMSIMWPLLAVSIAWILFYIIFMVKETDIEIHDCGTDVKVSRITRYVLPYIAGVLAIIAGIDFLWAFGTLTLYYMVITKTFDVKKLINYVDWKLVGWVAVIIAVANFVRNHTDEITEFLNNTGLIITEPTGFIALSTIAFGASWLMGSSSRFGAFTVILTSIYGIEYLPWFFAIDFSGYMLSPMHKCVAIGKMYFGTKLSHYVKILGVWAIGVITTAGILLYA